jgi:peptide/nickel transport system substrate-binding protein
VTAAKALLAKAGVNTSTPITVAVDAGNVTSVELFTLIQAEAAQIGLKLKIDEMQPLQYSSAYYSGPLRKGVDFIMGAGYLDLADPLDYLAEFFGPSAIFDWTNYNNPTVSADIAKAQATFNPQTRMQLLTAAQAIYEKSMTVIPLLTLDEVLYMNKKFTGAPASFSYLYSPSLAGVGTK